MQVRLQQLAAQQQCKGRQRNPGERHEEEQFVQELLDRAAEQGLIAPGQAPHELAAELVVATRPLSSRV